MNRKHGPILLIITVLCLAGLGFALWDMTKPPYQPPEITETAENEIAPAQITTIPDAPFLTIGGEQAALHDFKGKVLLLNFWATWCIPCQLEMQTLQDIYTSNTSKLAIIGINLGENPQAVAQWVDDYGLTYDILLDPLQTIAHIYQIRGQPST